MTNHKSDSLSLSDIETILEKQISTGEVLASCPLCTQYISEIEYKTRKCFSCKKEIVFQNILYYPGAKKDNN